MVKDLQLPVDKDGNIVHADYSWAKYTKISNYSFEGIITFYNYYSGNHVVFYFKDSNGRGFPMSFSIFMDLIQKPHLDGPSFNGKWTFRKQGKYFSVKPVKE